MISLQKGPKPAQLRTNAAAWTAALLKAVRSGRAPTPGLKTKYNTKEIKSALLKETAGKCAYCESFFEHVTHGDIEHIVPKVPNYKLWFEWANLTIACDVCNTNKGQEIVLDPYTENPGAHLWFAGPIVLARAGSGVGQTTILVLRLNRDKLLARRIERIEALTTRAREIFLTPNATLKRLLLRALTAEEVERTKEFSGCAQHFVRSMRDNGSLSI